MFLGMERRKAHVTPGNNGPVLLIVSWFLMVLMIILLVLRLVVRFATAHLLGIDDALLCIATLLGIGEVVAISFSVHEGLGRLVANLSNTQRLASERDLYIAAILYICALAFAKASALRLVSRLAYSKPHKLLVRTMEVVVIMWALAALIAISFQCNLPDPWDIIGGKCFNVAIFWDVIGAIDIATDLALIALPTRIVWDLNLIWQEKLVVASAFLLRIIVIAAQVTRLVFLQQLQNTEDFTNDYSRYGIATQCLMVLAVLISCVPALKPFMDRAASGMLALTLEYGSGTYGLPRNYILEHGERNGRGPAVQLDQLNPREANLDPADDPANWSAAGRIQGGENNSWSNGEPIDSCVIQKKVSLDMDFIRQQTMSLGVLPDTTLASSAGSSERSSLSPERAV